MEVLSQTLDTASVRLAQLDRMWARSRRQYCVPRPNVSEMLLRMKTRRFGRLGWPVSEIGTGMWGMVGWTGADEDEVKRALQRAVDLGCNFFDTAFAYGE